MKRHLALTIFVVFAFLGASFASAQTKIPEIIISWQALNSYSPSFFQGKTLASKNSIIVADLLVIDQGSIVDLSQTEVRWFLNGKLIQSGLGLTELEFPLGLLPRRHNELSVTLRQYQGADITKTANIPLPGPTLLFNGSGLKNPGDKQNVELFAYPFFFNIKSIEELEFIWSLNSNISQGLGSFGAQLTVNLSAFSAGDKLDLIIEAEKIDDSLERAEYIKALTIQ